MKTFQELFDMALHGVRGQGYEKSKTDFGDEGESGCAYRGECGRKCGVGHMIPDPIYDPSIEGITPNNVIEMRSEISEYGGYEGPLKVHFVDVLDKSGIGTDNDTLSFLGRVQAAHDDMPGFGELAMAARRFEDAMYEVALTYGLQYASPVAA